MEILPLSGVDHTRILFQFSEREISGHQEMGTVQRVSHTREDALTSASRWNLSCPDDLDLDLAAAPCCAEEWGTLGAGWPRALPPAPG